MTSALLIRIQVDNGFQHALALRNGIVFRRTLTGPNVTKWRHAVVTQTSDWLGHYVKIASETRNFKGLTWTRIPLDDDDLTAMAEGHVMTPAVEAMLNQVLTMDLSEDEATITEGLRTWFLSEDNDDDWHTGLTGSLIPEPREVTDIERIIEVGRGLRSESGENPAYDKALVEMACDLLGEANKRLVAIAMHIDPKVVG